MLNTVAKFLLIATSLSPLLGAVAVSEIARGQSVIHWAPWVAIALLLTIACWGLLKYARRRISTSHYHVVAVERSDKEALAFLITYLLPFVSSDKTGFVSGWLTGGYVLLIILMTAVHAGAFHFNPVMGLFGYHFYSVRNADGVSHLLISRSRPPNVGDDVQVVRLADGIYLGTGDKNA